MEKTRDYTTVSIPLDLMNKIDNALKKGGYQNRSDFVRDAIRDRLKGLQEL
ncbi:MAG: ribbon-helix-helix domain-containing protein [Candidatus Bathyarchaeota archaeon]|nr:ribbon-helix-helix domain-containing protein [Candidatus Termiticorpusculum sp.]